jgi:hypothetical protein
MKSFNFLIGAIAIIVTNLGYDLILILRGINMMHQAELRIYGLINGLTYIMILLMLIASGRLVIKHTVIKYVIAIGLICILGASVGLLRGNNLVYMASDLYKFLLIPLAYIVYSNLVKYNNYKKLLILLIITLLIDGIFDMSYQLMRYSHGNFQKISDQFWINKVLLINLIIAFFLRYRMNILVFAVLSGIALFSIYISTYRTAVALTGILIVGYIVVLLRHRKQKIKIIQILGVFSALIFIGPIVVNLSGETVQNAMEGYKQFFAARLEEFYQRDSELTSGVVKILEINSALDEMHNESSLVYLFGMGAGAEYTPSNDLHQKAGGYRLYTEKTGVETIHHIHIQYFSHFFRYGLLGLVIVFYVLYLTFKLTWKAYTSTNHDWLAFAVFLQFFIALIDMLFFQHVFFGDANWGLFLALVTVLQSNLLYRPDGNEINLSEKKVRAINSISNQQLKLNFR